ncbi:DEAD/DEAH box helicase [Devosia sp. PTR5]|uniref:DEAD/DEAH box helicase n=1 Tax=Devosia oryzisoli TaxID=2774138 RepID=A0A927FRT2_9HYPH|nr:DEAD/DEAH box helicase [Devosia oryzisoli]MBD8065060.1 DEAD/DEAH box helicase [Devosia oryzisoli]
MSLPETILPSIARALEAKGYDSLTPVQSAIIEDETAGRDLLVSAQTGSGKTVAFGMAIAPTLLGDAETLPPPGAPLALAIAPTRELALQVQRELEWLYRETGARTASCVGGMDPRSERKALDRGCHIVVGTPGRLRDHITRGALDMSALRAVVLDEADEMLDLGFKEDLEFILAAAPEDRRTLLFSATVPKAIAQLAKTYQRDALRIAATSAGEQHADIDYKLMVVPANDKENAVINTLLWYDNVNTIIFAHTRESVKHLSARLHNRGFGVVTISGELSQAERTNALQAMRDGRASICVATDVAARGIDLPNLDLVIHADMPSNPDTLLHRSGRTGRAGRKGTCVIIAASHRRGVAQRILRSANLQVEMMTPPTAAEIEEKAKEAMLSAEALSIPVSEEEADLVARLLERHSPEAIAAAYLRQQLATRPAPEDITVMAAEPERKRTREDFSNGSWFKISVGRKQRAEPRWLLPLICKAGGLTKGDVGSIRLFQNESIFEVTADKAANFLATVQRNGTGERNVRIEAAIPPGVERPRPAGKTRPATSYDPLPSEPAPAAAKPKKPRKAEADDAPPAPQKKKAPVEAKGPKKDKGKPNWSKPREIGDQPVKRKKAPKAE